MDLELFWYDDDCAEGVLEGIQEQRASYNVDLSQNDLVAWKNAIELAVVIYEITVSWPKSETYGMTNQVRRAAVSTAANIAEGQGRSGKREFLHFLYIALGSLREVETHLVVARRIGYVEDGDFERATRACVTARKPLRGLINHLSKDDSNGK